MSRISSCANCDFWKSLKDGWGACRRHSPVVVDLAPQQLTEDGSTHVSVFPMTESEEWCGDYVIRENLH